MTSVGALLVLLGPAIALLPEAEPPPSPTLGGSLASGTASSPGRLASGSTTFPGPLASGPGAGASRPFWPSGARHASTWTSSTARAPEVAFLPTEEAERRGSPIDPRLRRAFGQRLRTAAGRRLVERGFVVIRHETTLRALSSLGGRPCPPAGCGRLAAERLGATHFVRSLLRRLEGDVCLAQVDLHIAPSGTSLRSLEARVDPCDLDGLLVQADGLGGRLGEGPRHQPPVGLPLTSAPLPDIHLADIPEIVFRDAVRTATTPSGARQFPLDRALEHYRSQSIQIFRDENGGVRFARNGELLGECALRRAVSAPISPETDEFCEGNGWAWAFLGIPAGGLLVWASAPQLDQGQLAGFVGVALGLITAVTSGALAATRMRFGHADASGEYRSSFAELERLARSSNRSLRRELGLTEAEVGLLP